MQDHKPTRNDLSRKHFAERIAYNLGFRVSADGKTLASPTGVKMLWDRGYAYFGLNAPTGRCKCHVHRLVAYQKYGERIYEPGIVVRHLDSNSANNADSNIEIGTFSDNAMDCPVETRRRKSALANLRYDHAGVFESFAAGMTYRQIMAKFGIPSLGTVSHIVHKFTPAEKRFAERPAQ